MGDFEPNPPGFVSANTSYNNMNKVPKLNLGAPAVPPNTRARNQARTYKKAIRSLKAAIRSNRYSNSNKRQFASNIERLRALKRALPTQKYSIGMRGGMRGGGRNRTRKV